MTKATITELPVQDEKVLPRFESVPTELDEDEKQRNYYDHVAALQTLFDQPRTDEQGSSISYRALYQLQGHYVVARLVFANGNPEHNKVCFTSFLSTLVGGDMTAWELASYFGLEAVAHHKEFWTRVHPVKPGSKLAELGFQIAQAGLPDTPHTRKLN